MRPVAPDDRAGVVIETALCERSLVKTSTDPNRGVERADPERQRGMTGSTSAEGRSESW